MDGFLSDRSRVWCGIPQSTCQVAQAKHWNGLSPWVVNNSFKGMGSRIHCNRRLMFSGSKNVFVQNLCVKVCGYKGKYLYSMLVYPFWKLVETPHLETSNWHVIWIDSITRKLSIVQGLFLSRWEPHYCFLSPSQRATPSNLKSHWCMILHSSIHLTVCVDKHIEEKSGSF